MFSLLWANNYSNICLILDPVLLPTVHIEIHSKPVFHTELGLRRVPSTNLFSILSKFSQLKQLYIISEILCLNSFITGWYRHPLIHTGTGTAANSTLQHVMLTRHKYCKVRLYFSCFNRKLYSWVILQLILICFSAFRIVFQASGATWLLPCFRSLSTRGEAGCSSTRALLIARASRRTPGSGLIRQEYTIR